MVCSKHVLIFRDLKPCTLLYDFVLINKRMYWKHSCETKEKWINDLQILCSFSLYAVLNQSSTQSKPISLIAQNILLVSSFHLLFIYMPLFNLLFNFFTVKNKNKFWKSKLMKIVAMKIQWVQLHYEQNIRENVHNYMFVI